MLKTSLSKRQQSGLALSQRYFSNTPIFSALKSESGPLLLPGQRVADSGQSDPLSAMLQSVGIGGLGRLVAGGGSGATRRGAGAEAAVRLALCRWRRCC